MKFAYMLYPGRTILKRYGIHILQEFDTVQLGVYFNWRGKIEINLPCTVGNNSTLAGKERKIWERITGEWRILKSSLAVLPAEWPQQAKQTEGVWRWMREGRWDNLRIHMNTSYLHKEDNYICFFVTHLSSSRNVLTEDEALPIQHCNLWCCSPNVLAFPWFSTLLNILPNHEGLKYSYAWLIICSGRGYFFSPELKSPFIQSNSTLLRHKSIYAN